jgi:luciferase-type oxidoreductase
MAGFNAAYARVFPAGGISLGIMTPFASPAGVMADVGETLRLAALADRLQFAALWTRDVPVMVPQGSDNSASALDDPFLWLGALASATTRIAIGAAAIVLPLRHPLHVAKSALTLDRISKGRFILGLGSGDRPAEFSAFGEDLEARGDSYRERWPLLRAALAPQAREMLLAATGGYDIMQAPAAQIPMIVVGTARQSCNGSPPMLTAGLLTTARKQGSRAGSTCGIRRSNRNRPVRSNHSSSRCSSTCWPIRMPRPNRWSLACAPAATH